MSGYGPTTKLGKVVFAIVFLPFVAAKKVAEAASAVKKKVCK